MKSNGPPTGISVIMPVYNYSNFISRAVSSLIQQSFSNWELIIVNDGAEENIQTALEQFIPDARIRYIEHGVNKGLGASLNVGIANATHDLVAYLPADDVYYREHLATLFETLNADEANVMAYSGVKHHYNRKATGMIDGYCLQLVQVLHKKVDEVWVERDELVTDDLARMYWDKVVTKGKVVSTEQLSCEWVDHPQQRHKVIQEPLGGINPYKLRYKVSHPLRFHSTKGNYIDEHKYYEPFTHHKYLPQSNGLKIVLVGELAYNAERVLALAERGHKLYGLWMDDPYWYNYVGPLAFGNIEDISFDDCESHIKEIQPDVIYALLNWQAVPFAYKVMKMFPHIPFVWHFKEGPFICLEKGTWKELIDLYNFSDGQIYCSEEMQQWFEQFIRKSKRTLVLDGDLPKQEWFTTERSPLISGSNKGIHTVVPGRPIGLHPHTVAALAEQEVHLHFYGDFTHGQWREWINKTMLMAPGFLHIHPNCTQQEWVKEFSQYDAGWLHTFQSENHGELMKANWDDLNIPARMATLAAAGLPMIQFDNNGHTVATQSLVKKHELGIFYNTIPDLAAQLRDKTLMNRLRENVWRHRKLFCFDEHADALTSFFISVIQSKAGARVAMPVHT